MHDHMRTQYRAAAAAVVRRGDRVLQIGCQLDATTAVMTNAGAEVIGADVDRKRPATAGKMCPGVKLHLVDLHDVVALQRLAAGGPIDVVMLDATLMMGHELPLDSMALGRRLELVFRSTLRTLVIRCAALGRLSRQVTTTPRLQALVAASTANGKKTPEPPSQNRPPTVVGAVGVDEYRKAALALVTMMNGAASFHAPWILSTAVLPRI
jgi:hypothetical protein